MKTEFEHAAKSFISPVSLTAVILVVHNSSKEEYCVTTQMLAGSRSQKDKS